MLTVRPCLQFTANTFKISFLDAIHLVDAPRVQNFTRNTTAEIKCIVGGDPEIRFYWEIGGIPFVDIFSSGMLRCMPVT